MFIHLVIFLLSQHPGELPLNMIQTQSTESTNGPGGGDTPLTKTFPMVTLAQW